MADRAIALVIPVIDGFVANGITEGRESLHIIVGFRRVNGTGDRLTTFNYGPTSWKHEYDKIADGKFDISVTTGRPSRLVHTMEPEWLEDGDVKYGGSFVLNSIVVAASGFQSYLDEMVCAQLCHTGRGLLHHLRAQLEAEADATDDDIYLRRSRWEPHPS